MKICNKYLLTKLMVQACDCKRDAIVGSITSEGNKIFPFLRSGVEAQRGVKIHQSLYMQCLQD